MNMDGPPQTARRQQSPARALVVGVARRVGQAIGLTSPRLPDTVGESPFAQSLAGSSIQSPAESDGAAGEVNVDATNNGAEIEQNMIRDFDSGGDGGDSDEEGGEADVHNFQCRSHSHNESVYEKYHLFPVNRCNKHFRREQPSFCTSLFEH